MAGAIREVNSMNYASKVEFEYGDLCCPSMHH